jgi:hypothetical protein
LDLRYRRTVIWRVIPVAILLALAVTGGGASAQSACPGTEYTGPTTGSVVILPKGTPVAEHHQVQLTFTGQNQGEVVPGSASFELDGPGGHLTLPGGEDGAAKWTVPAAGHYEISAHWTQYRCADASAPTYAAGSAPAVSFDAIKEQRPGIAHNIFRFARHVTHHLGVTRTIPARVTLAGGPDCPLNFTAVREPLVTTLYYRRGTSAPTHASPHVTGRFPGGCDSPLDGSAGAHRGRGFSVAASGRFASIEVVEPTRMRVIIEVTSGGALVGTIHATFRPTRTGESIVVR